MSRPAIIEYFIGLIGLYRTAKKSEKTKLLDQAVAITGKSRRTIERYLATEPAKLQVAIKIQGRGRQPLYAMDLLLPHVRKIWKAMEMASSGRMFAALPAWLRCDEASIRGLPTTIAAPKALRSRVPINTLDRSATRPGFTQGDTVAHCGGSAAGPFLSSLTVTDLYSGWTDNRAIAGKKAIEVKRALSSIKTGLPFDLIALNTDSGSEFINAEMLNWVTGHSMFPGQAPIQFTRSRPYKKDDNCYVEQRNYTHVRQLFEYYRYEDPALIDLMNEIYVEIWNPLNNFFLPSQKLIEKVRVGSKVVKKYDSPKTPAERLLSSNVLTPEQSEKIKAERGRLDPFELSKRLESKLKEFFARYRNSITDKEAA